jgi:hypothetical protein
VKSHIRDYATEAFRFYAKINMSADKYKQKIYDEALFDYKNKVKGSGISCPTEAAIIAAENEVTQKLAEIKDMEAVEMALAEIRARAYERSDIVQAIEMVYFKDADKPLEKGDIHNRVHFAELNIPASESSIYRWLSKARTIFAEQRGLRI